MNAKFEISNATLFWTALAAWTGFLAALFYFITQPSLAQTSLILGIVGTLSTVILGIIAIWLSLYFYNQSTVLNATLNNILSRIESSSKATEMASKDVMGPMLTTVLSIVQNQIKTKISIYRNEFMEKAADALEKVMSAPSTSDKDKYKKEFFEALDRMLSSIRHEVGNIKISMPEVMYDYVQDADITKSVKATTVSLALDSPFWISFIRRIYDIEHAHNFVSVKWLRETKFADDMQDQEALQIAIDKSILLTYRRDNPDHPKYPVLCCKLNIKNSKVRKVLDIVEENVKSEMKVEKHEK